MLIPGRAVVKDLIFALNFDLVESSLDGHSLVLKRHRHRGACLGGVRDSGSGGFLSVACLLSLVSLRSLQMLGLAIHVLATLSLLASIALGSAGEVVVLGVGADPAAVREVKLIFAASGVTIHGLAVLVGTSLGLFLLVLAPLGSACVETVSLAVKLQCILFLVGSATVIGAWNFGDSVGWHEA